MEPSTPQEPHGSSHAGLHARMILAQVERRMFGRGETHKAQIGRYIVLDAIGSGGMGTVYLAYDPKLHRRIALKVLRADAVNGASAKKRLRREAAALARLSDPGVVKIHEVGDFEGEVFLAMEYVDGVNLAQWANREPRNRARRRDEALRLLAQAAQGLAAAHRAGLVHRDVKPANILVGNDDRARIADFGLVRQADRLLSASGSHASPPSRPRDRSSSTTGALAGTPHYASPEQQCGLDVDAKTDQFSFCVTAWEILFDRPPWTNSPNAHAPPATPPGEPTWLADALRRGLHPVPSRRYASMDRLIAVLTSNPPRRRRRIALALASVLSISVAAGAYGYRRATRCDQGDAPLANAGRLRAGAVALNKLHPSQRWAIDDYASRWRAASREACESPHGQGSARDCLRLAEYGLLGVLAAGRSNDRALARLPDPAACLTASAAWDLPHARGTQAVDRILFAYLGLGEAQALRDLGEERRARSAFGRAVTDGSQATTPAVAIAVLRFEGETARRNGDHARSATLVAQAYELALSDGNTRDAATFASTLSSVAAAQANEAAAALWARHVALLTR